MNSNITLRVLKEAEEILQTKCTIRELANIFKVSKSTIHKDLHERLKEISLTTFNEVKELMQDHIETRHIKGGESTRAKYKQKRA